MKVDFTKITYGFFFACAVAGLTYLGVTKYYEKEIAFGEEYDAVIHAVGDVEKVYYDDTDKDVLSMNMVSGLVNGLNDRFSMCLSHNDYIELGVNNSAQFAAGGFKIARDKDSGNILIEDVEKGSYAEEIGLCKNDLILSIDGVSVSREGYYNIIENLIGKKGTSAELVVEHNGQKKNITYVRDKDFDKIETSKNKLYDNGIYYCKFDYFDSDTPLTFSMDFDSVLSENDIKGLILDMRENTGGNTDETVKFFDMFAPSGNHVVTKEAKSGKEDVYSTTDDVKYKGIKVVVLTSEKTLSSGEIIAAFFQDTKLGTVVGTQTGGKGVFQRTTYVNNWQYSLVAGYYYVNNIPNYDGVGITPDIVIDMDDDLIGTEDDIQLKKALELLS